jgi:hypothetical protein
MRAGSSRCGLRASGPACPPPRGPPRAPGAFGVDAKRDGRSRTSVFPTSTKKARSAMGCGGGDPRKSGPGGGYPGRLPIRSKASAAVRPRDDMRRSTIWMQSGRWGPWRSSPSRGAGPPARTVQPGEPDAKLAAQATQQGNWKVAAERWWAVWISTRGGRSQGLRGSRARAARAGRRDGARATCSTRGSARYPNDANLLELKSRSLSKLGFRRAAEEYLERHARTRAAPGVGAARDGPRAHGARARDRGPSRRCAST